MILVLFSGCSLIDGIRGKKKKKKSRTEIVREINTGKPLYDEILSNLESKKLAFVLNSWIGTPYRYGGDTKDGADCSGFVKAVYSEAFNQDLNRSSLAMLNSITSINKEDLIESDLVFFNIPGPTGYHVGIYLRDQYFIHASSSRGIMISSLNEAYFSKYYLSAGRLKK